MIIEQDAQEVRESFALNTNAALERIRLAEAEVWSAGDMDLESVGESVDSGIQFRPAKAHLTVHSLALEVEFEFWLRTRGENPIDLFRLDCRFEARYSLRPDFKPTDSQIKAFHRGNAVFNCWPFFREFVQNTAIRTHFPPPPVPFLRLMPKPPSPPPAPPTKGSDAGATETAVPKKRRQRVNVRRTV